LPVVAFKNLPTAPINTKPNSWRLGEKTDLAEGHAGIRRKAAPLRFDEAVQRFLDWSKYRHRPKTHDAHTMHCDTLKRFFGTKWLDQITPETVEQFRSARLREQRKNANDGSTIAPATVNRALETLRLIFNHLELKSPTRKEMFFDEEEQTRVVSVPEELAYFREASQPLRDIAGVILQTGMHPDEVFRMEVRNLDFARRSILNPSGKTKAAKRTIPMTRHVYEILQARSNAARGRWVFSSPAGPGRSSRIARSKVFEKPTMRR
jgi:integrase